MTSSPRTPARPGRVPGTAGWIGLGLVYGSLLALGRARALVFVHGEYRGVAPQLAEWRAAGALPSELALALALGLGAAFVAWRIARSLSRSPERPFARLALSLAVAFGVATLVAVRPPGAPDFERLDALAGDWLRRHAVLWPAVLAAALTLVVFAARLERSAARRRVAVLAAGVVAALFAGVGYAPLCSPSAPRMRVREVVREVLFTQDGWTVHRARPDAPPQAGILSPSVDYKTDSADLPSLVMPPPCEVGFRVGRDDGEVVLRVAAGLDTEVGRDLVEHEALTFGFEIEKNGASVFEREQHVWRETPLARRTWHRPEREEARALRLAPGDEIRLRTWIVGLDDEEALALPAYRVGFGELVLERYVERERVRASPRTPNIVLIVQDTLRSDRLSSYAYEKPTTPNLDRLAARGVRFEQAYSTSSWTWPSTASILTGLLPDAHGVTDDSSCYLAGRNETLAEALQARGYTTAAFTRNPLIVPEKNFDQGFETFDSHSGGFEKTDAMLLGLEGWMDRHASARFFLYLHLVDPHAPHRPREEDLARLGGREPEGFPGDSALPDFNRALLSGWGYRKDGSLREDVLPAGYLGWFNDVYDATVASADFYVGAVLDRLEYLGLEGRTIVAFTSDHGEEWLDHGTLTHGQTVHRELVQVPLILAGPGLPRGAVVEVPVSNRHLAPTLARFGGAEIAAVRDALDLAAASPGRAGGIEARAIHYSTTHGYWNGRRGRQPIYGIRDARWVLHYAPLGSDFGVPADEAPEGGQLRLFDVERDPQERVDLGSAHPDVAAALRGKILRKIEELLASRGPEIELGAGASTQRLLNEVGYAEFDEGEDGSPDPTEDR